MTRVVLQTIASVLMVAVALLAPAGDLGWPMGWAVLGVFTAFAAAALVALPPALLAERSKLLAGGERSDVVLSLAFGAMLYPGMFIACGLDRRFAWSPSPPLVFRSVALALFAAGYAFAFWAMRVNPYFATVVRVQNERGHQVVDRGPYAWVRHPGYAGAVVGHLAIPVALGTLWGLLPAFIGSVLVGMRAVNEERTLRRGLAGYAEYMARVRWRLFPGIW